MIRAETTGPQGKYYTSIQTSYNMASSMAKKTKGFSTTGTGKIHSNGRS